MRQSRNLKWVSVCTWKPPPSICPALLSVKPPSEEWATRTRLSSELWQVNLLASEMETLTNAEWAQGDGASPLSVRSYSNSPERVSVCVCVLSHDFTEWRLVETTTFRGELHHKSTVELYFQLVTDEPRTVMYLQYLNLSLCLIVSSCNNTVFKHWIILTVTSLIRQ